MPPTELAIVGNGFDMALGLPSSFTAFKDYVQVAAFDVHEAIENYLQVDGDWRHLEEAFACFDGHSAMDEAADQLVGYGADDWSDAYHHAPQQAARSIADHLTDGIRNQLLNWAREIDAHVIDKLVTMPLTWNITYLTFNYTQTLQRVFCVPDPNVLHIHGQAARGGPLVLGHARPSAGSRALSSPHDNEDGDVRMLEAGQILDDVIDATSKPSIQIIRANTPFFDKLSNVARIVVLGHSLAEVDHPYFEAVAEKTPPHACWRISCYTDDDRERAEDLRCHLGITTKRWSTFDLSTWLIWN